MSKDNKTKSSDHLLNGVITDWDVVVAMRIVHNLHSYWKTLSEEDQTAERWMVSELVDDEGKKVGWDTEDQIFYFCGVLADYFSDELETEIDEERALELCLSFFKEKKLSEYTEEEERERADNNPVIALREMVWNTGFNAGVELVKQSEDFIKNNLRLVDVDDEGENSGKEVK